MERSLGEKNSRTQLTKLASSTETSPARSLSQELQRELDAIADDNSAATTAGDAGLESWTTNELAARVQAMGEVVKETVAARASSPLPRTPHGSSAGGTTSDGAASSGSAAAPSSPLRMSPAVFELIASGNVAAAVRAATRRLVG